MKESSNEASEYQTNLIKTLPHYIASNINVQFPSDDRSTTSAALADIGLEHYRSISKLLNDKYYGSASALMRPLFEVTILSMWVYFSATDKELERFIDGKQLFSRTRTNKNNGKPSSKIFDEYVKELSGINTSQYEIIQSDKHATWKALNSFTHGGLYAMSRRFSDDKIKPNYPPIVIEQIAEFCNQYAVFIFHHVAVISKSSSLLTPVNDAFGMLNEINTTT